MFFVWGKDPSKPSDFSRVGLMTYGLHRLSAAATALWAASPGAAISKCYRLRCDQIPNRSRRVHFAALIKRASYDNPCLLSCCCRPNERRFHKLIGLEKNLCKSQEPLGGYRLVFSYR